MTTAIEELRARVAEQQAKAKAAALTDEEQEMASLFEQEKEASESMAAAEATRRANDMALRLAVAEREAGGRYLVAGVDLVKLFPVGKAPPVEKLPGKGVIVVRDPKPESYDAFTREIEAKIKPHSALYTDLLCGCSIDPKPESNDALLLRTFCERYPGASIGAGDVAAKLGGARTQADKRGRA